MTDGPEIRGENAAEKLRLDRLWHAMPAEAVLAALASSPDGLREPDLAPRRARFGQNVLPRPRRPGRLAIYLRQFRSPLIYLLLAAAAVSVVVGEVTDAVFIFVVLQINAVIGAVQEWRAATGAEALDKLVSIRAVLRRDGVPCEVDAAEIVPGDIVRLESGARVPADLRVIEAHELRVDESLFTGESVPVDKSGTSVLEEETTVADRRNMLHAGTVVIGGRGLGVATQIGLHTQVGRIAQALTGTPSPPLPLLVRLARFTRLIGIATMLAVVALAAAEIMRGTPPFEVFVIAVALVVSAIPEGLPVAITVALSVATARMARRGVMIRALPAVEGLGACTLIASDKTGTLTCNELTATRLELPGFGAVEVTGEGYRPEGGLVRHGAPLAGGDAAAEAAHRLVSSIVLCNEASFRQTDSGYVRLGDTVDVAFLVLGAKLGLEQTPLLDLYPPRGLIPFESERRFASSVNGDGRGGLRAHVKGAAETVLPMCAGVDRVAALAAADRLAAAGYRVLAVAAGAVPEDFAFDGGSRAGEALRGLTYLGLVCLIDPVRPEVPDAIARCRQAGIAVSMITGDHPATALAIARELGMADDAAEVVTGAELKALADDPPGLAAAIARGRVFARVDPVQKLDIVNAQREAGHFAAVTGDGVNDAPALRAADIGVAMGRGGTDVARDAADLVLTDDNFASIVNGVEEGRVAYDNVRKVTYLLISTGVAEIVLFFCAVVAGLPLPLHAVQLLWLNLVTNGIQDVALAFEKGEPGVVRRRPRPPRQPLFDSRMIAQTAVSGVAMGLGAFLFYRWALAAGWGEFESRNAVLLLLVLFENAHAFNCRSETRSVFAVAVRNNPLLILAVVAAQGVHLGAMYLPGMRDVLDLEPVSFERWLTVAGFAFGLIAVMELFKAVGQRVEGAAP